MGRRSTALLIALATLLAGTLAFGPGAAGAASGPVDEDRSTLFGRDGIRFATFNASLNRTRAGELVTDLSSGTDEQARTIAEIVQRVRPDVVLLNEFDYDAAGSGAELFQRNYLSVGQGGAEPIAYPYRFTAPSNTGVPSGVDLNNDGVVATEPGQPGYAEDAFGFGEFPGQYGMVLYSRYPIEVAKVRTFATFLWKDMPGANLPVDPATGRSWYSAAALEVFRLSSKSHWDLPIRVGRRTVHLLASHPTPPTFDGPEDRNGRRNHDEIRFWADYVTGGKTARYIYDDAGRRGGLRSGARFVIAGDLNADPYDGDSYARAVNQLLEHRAIDAEPAPASKGAVEASAAQGGANHGHRGDPAHDTADFADAVPAGPGNLRVDYVLPSKGLARLDGGVFWPPADDPLFRLTGNYPFPSSDHRLVWVDLHIGPAREKTASRRCCRP